MLKFHSLFLGLLIVLKVVSALIIELPDGKVEGISDTTREGTNFYGFLALRYAEPPVGELRFKPPQPLKPWDDIYNGTEEKNICYQVVTNSDKENEDCLFANVFTPVDVSNASHASDLAVMVWIHGGGFTGGAAYRAEGGVGPKFFMDAGVVLVSINYRLGPFGFMSSGDNVIPGNLGLKDQAEALRWVQKNIEYFGGDPNKVTIFGQSAGSASVSYQLLNPHVKGLFRAAILESGSALSPWAYQRNETEVTYQTAQLIDPDFTSKNSTELLEFLQSVPAASIDKASAQFTSTTESPANYQISKGFFYAPVIEASNDDAILTKTQYELLESGYFNQVPVFMGMTNEESLGFLTKGDLSSLWGAYDEDPSILVPFDMHLTDAEAKKYVGENIWSYFTDDQGFNVEDWARGIMYHSVQDFDKANIKQAEVISQHSTVYFYQFSYSGLMGNFNYRMPGCGNVTHSEELNYIFSKRISNEIPDNTDMSCFPESDQKVHYRIMALWTNFAKYLNPTPSDVDVNILQNVTWEEVKPNDFKYLDIGTDLVMTKGYPKEEKYLYWTSLYDKNAIPPLDTF
ncbi:esterase FE4-like [Euwallacea similis]|uniref:esterase FE4-like n=1 Tax=Euwallacea similis TaxID=1736056 RepID=UPI00344B633D